MEQEAAETGQKKKKIHIFFFFKLSAKSKFISGIFLWYFQIYVTVPEFHRWEKLKPTSMSVHNETKARHVPLLNVRCHRGVPLPQDYCYSGYFS